LIINLGLLLGFYYTVGKKPAANALKQRRASIAKDIEDARKRYDEAKERAKKYQGDLDNADADAATAKAALITAGKGEVERQLADAEEKAERMKRDASRLVEQEQKQIHQDLHREAVDRAVTEAMTVLERTVTAEDHARFAQDLLAELAKRPSAKSGGSVRPTGGAS
jgi:F0F1-type ATP synthase membrane subunit b/b'